MRQCDAMVSVLLGNLGSIHVDVPLTGPISLNLVQTKSLFMETVFSNGSGLFQQDDASCHCNNGSGALRNNNQFKVLTWLQSPQISVQSSICGTSWTNKADPWRLHLTTSGLKGSAAEVLVQIPELSLRGLEESRPPGSGPTQYVVRWS